MTQAIQEQITFGKDVELITITDLDGFITYTNDEYQKVLGYHSEELIGLKVNSLDHADMPKIAGLNLKAKKKQRKSWAAAVKKQHLNGSFYWVKEVLTPIYENSSVVAYQSVCRGLSAIEQANAEAIYSEVRIRNSVVYSWENFYCRLALYAVASIFVFSAGLFSSLLFYLFMLMPFIIYYGEVIKSETFFESTTGSFEDITRSIFNKKMEGHQNIQENSNDLAVGSSC